MTNTIVEWAPFNLKHDSNEAALLEASDAMQSEFLERQSGYLKRQLLKGPGESYVDLVWWASMAEAEAAMAKVSSSKACAMYFSHMRSDQTEAGSGVLHLEAVRTYQPTNNRPGASSTTGVRKAG